MTDTTTTANTGGDSLRQERWDWTSVGEQLFDRERATREGHCYATGRAAVEQAIETLTWQSVEPGQTISAPMSPGEALRSVIAELRLPKVSALAWNGALEVRDDYEGLSLYSLYGIAAHYRNGDAVGSACRPRNRLPAGGHLLHPPARDRPARDRLRRDGAGRHAGPATSGQQRDPSTDQYAGAAPMRQQTSGHATDRPTARVGEGETIGEPLAEAAVLGCLLRSPAAHTRQVLAGLVESDWSVPQHAHVAAAITVLLEQNVPVDPVTVLGQLRRQGTEDATTACTDAGVLLLELYAAAPSLGSATYYAWIVREHSYRRRVQQAACRLLAAATSAALEDLHELVEQEHTAVEAHHKRTHAV